MCKSGNTTVDVIKQDAIVDSATINKTITRETLMDLSDPVFREALFKAHGGRCFHTQTDIKIENMDIDHLHARAKGGTDRLDNLVPSFFKVNRDKNSNYDKQIVERMIDFNYLVYLPKVIRYLENTTNSLRSRKPLSPELLQACNNIEILVTDNPSKLYTENELKKVLGEQSFMFNKIKRHLMNNKILKRTRYKKTNKYCHISRESNKDELYNAIVEFIRNEYIYDGPISPIRSHLCDLGISGCSTINEEDIDFLVSRGELIRTDNNWLTVKDKRALPSGIVYNNKRYEIHWTVVEYYKQSSEVKILDKVQIALSSFSRLSNAIKQQELFLEKVGYSYDESDRLRLFQELPEVESLYIEMKADRMYFDRGLYHGVVIIGKQKNIFEIGDIKVKALNIFELLYEMDKVVETLKRTNDEINRLREAYYAESETVRKLEEQIRFLKEA